jgi:hypothetical protein
VRKDEYSNEAWTGGRAWPLITDPPKKKKTSERLKVNCKVTERAELIAIAPSFGQKELPELLTSQP